MSPEEKDQMLEEMSPIHVSDSDVKPKQLYDITTKNFEILERFLVINARVFRNTDNIKNQKIVNEIFDFIIGASCNLGFLLIDEIESKLGENISEISTKDPKKSLLQLISSFLPNLIQNFITDSVGHINLEEIILNKIKGLESSRNKNQYRLFILYFLLIDLDLKKYKNYITDIIELSTIGVIRSSILLKLYYYLLMKCYDDESMITFIRAKLQRLTLEMYPKTKANDFDKNFERTYKLLLYKRQTNNG